MPAFQLIYLLIPFAFIVLLGVLFFFFNIFHIRRYAIKSGATTVVLLVYFVSFGLLLALIGGYLLTVNWHREFQPSDLLPSFRNSTRLE